MLINQIASLFTPQLSAPLKKAEPVAPAQNTPQIQDTVSISDEAKIAASTANAERNSTFSYPDGFPKDVAQKVDRFLSSGEANGATRASLMAGLIHKPMLEASLVKDSNGNYSIQRPLANPFSDGQFDMDAYLKRLYKEMTELPAPNNDKAQKARSEIMAFFENNLL